jgi:hypothetical protein
MRFHTDRNGHDPRQIDLFAVIVLLLIVFGTICYLSSPALVQVSKASFIEPSQSVRW